MTKEQFINDMINSKQIQEDYEDQEFIHNNEYSLTEYLNKIKENYNFYNKKISEYQMYSYKYGAIFKIIGIYYKEKLIYSALECYEKEENNTKFHIVYKDNKLYLTENYDCNSTLIIIDKDNIEKLEMILL